MSDRRQEKRAGTPESETVRIRTKPREKRERKEPLSFGEVVDRLSEDDWRVLIDLYFCRCMPLSAAVEHYFSNVPEIEYKNEWVTADSDKKNELTKKTIKRCALRGERRMRDLFKGGLLEKSSTNPDEVRKRPEDRKNGLKVEPWYFLSHRGLRLVEVKINVLEENKLSKLELDMERAKKDHFWELAKVYLDIKYNLMVVAGARQFVEWDWYPSLTIYGHKETSEIRPDAILRMMDQVYYIELDRSTEPIQRSPFTKGETAIQVSIQNKLERYRAVLHHSEANEIQRNGIIAFILPDAIYETRLKNIRAAASKVFSKNYNTQVLVGRTIQDIMDLRFELAKSTTEGIG